MIQSRAALIGNMGKTGRTVVQHDTGHQTLSHFVGELTRHTHHVLTLDRVSWMHEKVSELAARRKDQQPFRIEVETADHNPAAFVDRRQVIKDTRPAFRILHRNNLALRLVVQKNARQIFLSVIPRDFFPVHADFILGKHPESEIGGLPVHFHPAFINHNFHGAARTESQISEHLLKLLRLAACFGLHCGKRTLSLELRAGGHFRHAGLFFRIRHFSALPFLKVHQVHWEPVPGQVQDPV